MAAQRQFFDLWLVESDTVYREVPFTVVCDWVQQGRLLDEDQIRPSGTAEWRRLGGVPAFAAFLPKPEATPRPDDAAEALEPVTMEFHRKKRHVDEDDDVDMIPLIDVSMVLLVFFMLTASGAGAAALVNLSPVKAAPISDTSGISINIRLDDNKRPLYSLGEDGKPSADPDDLEIRDRNGFLKRFNARLASKTSRIDVTINPDRDLEDGVLVDTIRDVKDPRKVPQTREKVGNVYNGVTER